MPVVTMKSTVECTEEEAVAQTAIATTTTAGTIYKKKKINKPKWVEYKTFLQRDEKLGNLVRGGTGLRSTRNGGQSLKVRPQKIQA